MANSEVMTMAESGVTDGDHIGDSYLNASVSPLVSRWDDGLRSPSSGSSASQVNSHDASLRDPSVLFGELITKGASAEDATRMVMAYYDIVSAGATPVAGSSDVSTTSRVSNRSIRIGKWREEMSSLPLETGYCYLHVVRWSHRPHFRRALGPNPSMQTFIRLLRRDDLDFDAANRVIISRVRTDERGVDPCYHMDIGNDTGEVLSNFMSYLLRMLELYPFLSKEDFGGGRAYDGTLPLVGRVGLLPSSSALGSTDEAVSLVDDVSPVLLEEPGEAMYTAFEVSDDSSDDLDFGLENQTVSDFMVHNAPVSNTWFQHRSWPLYVAMLRALPMGAFAGGSFVFPLSGKAVHVRISELKANTNRVLNVGVDDSKIWFFRPESIRAHDPSACYSMSQTFDSQPIAFWRVGCANYRPTEIRVLRDTPVVSFQFTDSASRVSAYGAVRSVLELATLHLDTSILIRQDASVPEVDLPLLPTYRAVIRLLDSLF